MAVYCGGCVVLLAALHVVVAQVGFGDYDFGFDNPLATLWNGDRNTLVPDARRACIIGPREGTCLNAATCRFQRGRAEGRGTCSFWNTCCVFEKTANQTSDARVIYFVSTPGARDLPQPQRLFVRLASKNVCQMRADMISMNLEKPTVDTSETSATCVRDFFRVDPPSVDNPVPDICGTNRNTHFYVHLDATQMINNGIIFSIKLDATSTIDAAWNVKITQLECPGTRNALDLHSHKTNRNQVVSDFSQLAPAGCLQYFLEPVGEIHNFGYSSVTESTMTTDQDYAICFKPPPTSCGVSLTTTLLNLRSDVACTPEYIYVPEEGTNPKQCRLPAGTTITSKHPGPLYLHVFSPAVVQKMEASVVYGYQFSYDSSKPCS